MVRVDRGAETLVSQAFGLADRSREVPNTVGTRFALASGAKGFTALVMMSLVEDGSLALTPPRARSSVTICRSIDCAVTVEHLLAHRSGIGDYLDEDTMSDVKGVPDARARPHPRVNGGLPLDTGRAPAGVGARRAVRLQQRRLRRARADCGAGERGAVPSPSWPSGCVSRRVFVTPATCDRTSFRGDAALGYLWTDRPRTDASTSRCAGQATAGSTRRPPISSRFWEALFAGQIVSVDAVAEMLRPRSDWPEEKRRYGLGFHLHPTTDVVWLEGYDAGVSFTSTHGPDRRITATVISNTAEGAWPFVELFDRELGI